MQIQMPIIHSVLLQILNDDNDLTFNKLITLANTQRRKNTVGMFPRIATLQNM